MTRSILEIALPTPLHRTFDYLPPGGVCGRDLEPGIRLQVPFGHREATGLLLRVKDQPDTEGMELKTARQVLDDSPVVPPELLALADWAAGYYFHPRGDAIFHALPPKLRKGAPLALKLPQGWRLTDLGLGLASDGLKRSPRQLEAWQWLLANGVLAKSETETAGLSRTALKALVDKGWAELFTLGPNTLAAPVSPTVTAPTPNPDQQRAIDAINQSLGHFQAFLLDGITGSGKTEVYLRCIEQALARGEQALVLVPEIGLTPQTLARFRQRFGSRVASIHSGLSDGERLAAWAGAGNSNVQVIIGTRSAVFTPFKQLGLIVIDEEHDGSFKQQEGFRYSARDVAVKRAQGLGIPVVLGSATPSIESRHNAGLGRYTNLHLPERAGEASAPGYRLIDLRGQSLTEGFSEELLTATGQTLAAGNQALIFLNRRGFAPSLICHQCGWVAECPHCDARMVVHLGKRALRCHHCDTERPLPSQCPHCASRQLLGVGQGTERSEAFLAQHFPAYPVVRIDRDTTQRKGAMDELLAQVHQGEPTLLIGTQMLAKGHHFPDVTLVGVLDADAGLFSSDFRGPERTAQMLLQVAGRAGRAHKPGEVYIQSHNPEHPVLEALQQDRYPQLAEQLLAERKLLGLPPFGHLALIRCDGTDPELPQRLLHGLRQACQQPDPDASWVGPLPPPMQRRAGRHRFQLLLRHRQRAALHQLLGQCQQWLQANPEARRSRWSIDVDPQDLI